MDDLTTFVEYNPIDSTQIDENHMPTMSHEAYLENNSENQSQVNEKESYKKTIETEQNSESNDYEKQISILKEEIEKLKSENKELCNQVEYLERDNQRLISFKIQQHHNNMESSSSPSSPSSTSSISMPLNPSTILPESIKQNRRTSIRKQSMKPSNITIAMKSRNSLLVGFDNSKNSSSRGNGADIDVVSMVSEKNENEILEDNIREFTKNIRIGQYSREFDTNELVYIESIGCLMTLFHREHTLHSNGRSSYRKNNMNNNSVRLNQIFFQIVSYLSNQIIDKNNNCNNIDMLPYPTKWLYKSFPDNNETTQGRGWLPLHWYLAISNPNIEDMKYLYELYGEDAFEESVSPLSILVSSYHTKQSSYIHQNVHHTTTTTTTTTTITPENEKLSNSSIGISMADDNTYDLAVELLKLRPEAAMDRDSDGSYSIMHACTISRQNTAIIDLLYQSNPNSISESDNFGCYAIHYACYFGNYITVSYIIEKYPMSTSIVSGNGAFALHESVQNIVHGTIEFVKRVYESYTDAIHIADHNGALPLHLAAKYSDIHVVRFLCQEYSQAIHVKDKEGLTPIHYSSQRIDKNVEVIDYLAKVVKTIPVASPSKYFVSSNSNNSDYSNHNSHTRDSSSSSRFQDLMTSMKSWTASKSK